MSKFIHFDLVSNVLYRAFQSIIHQYSRQEKNLKISLTCHNVISILNKTQSEEIKITFHFIPVVCLFWRQSTIKRLLYRFSQENVKKNDEQYLNE